MPIQYFCTTKDTSHTKISKKYTRNLNRECVLSLLSIKDVEKNKTTCLARNVNHTTSHMTNSSSAGCKVALACAFKNIMSRQEQTDRIFFKHREARGMKQDVFNFSVLFRGYQQQCEKTNSSWELHK